MTKELRPLFEKITELSAIDSRLIAEMELHLVFPFKAPSREEFDYAFGPDTWEEEGLQRLEPFQRIKVSVPLNGGTARDYLRAPELFKVEDWWFDMAGQWDYICILVNDLLEKGLLHLRWEDVLSFELVEP